MSNAYRKYTSKKIASFSFTHEDVLDYREFSKDNNPIHLQGVVFGIQLIGRIEHHLEHFFHTNLVRISYYFLGKVMIDETIDLFVDPNNFEFSIQVGNTEVGKGSVAID